MHRPLLAAVLVLLVQALGVVRGRAHADPTDATDPAEIRGTREAKDTKGAAKLPLVAVELRAGDGVAFGAGRGLTVIKPSRFTLGLSAEIAVRSDPWLTAWAEVLLEVLHTAAMGVRGGARLYVMPSGVRATVGVAAIVAPTNLVGGSMALGYCKRVASKMRACFDVDSIVYFVGTDLPSHRVAGQLQLQLGVSFDAH